MTGAIPIPPEKLLEETRWLRALAASLAGDADPDDLAQEAWLQALRQKPDRIREPRRWLTTVLRHAFRRRHRDAEVRGRLERSVARPERVASTAALAARASLHRSVVEAVLSLEEPGRSVVLLRFFDDCKPREIARLQGIPVETVRTRLKRALASLRAKLDEEIGPRESWAWLALPTIGRGLTPASASTGGAGAAGGTGAASVTALGALLMSAQAKVGAVIGCVLLLSIGTAILWKPGGAGPFEIRAGAETRPADAAKQSNEPRAGGPAVAVTPAIVPKTFVEPPDRATQTTPGVIRGEVLDPDRTPADDVPVVVFDLRDGAPHSQASERTQTDERGRFSLTLEPPFGRKIALVAFKPMRRPATLILGAEQAEPVTLVLGEGATIEGMVLVDGHSPRRSTVGVYLGATRLQLSMTRARVSADIRPGVPGCFSGGDELWWAGTAFETKLAAVDCDAGGRFRIDGLASDTYRLDAGNLVDESGLNLDVRADIRAPASEVELALVTGRLRIRVEGNGRALEGGRVSVLNAEGGSIRTESADGLQFRIGAGVPLTVEAACAGFAQKSVPVPPLTPGEVRDLTIELEPAVSASFRLTLRGAEAMGLDRVSVRFVPFAEQDRKTTSALADLRELLVAVRTRADEFMIDHLPLLAGQYILVALPHSDESWFLPFDQDVTVPADGVLAVTHDAIVGGRVEVAGVGPDGTAVSGRWSLRDGSGTEVLSGHVVGAQVEVREFGSRDGMTMRAGGKGMAAAIGAQVLQAVASARVRANSIRRAPPGVIPAGSYELLFDADGFQTARRTVNVAAGTVNRFEIRATEPAAPR